MSDRVLKFGVKNKKIKSTINHEIFEIILNTGIHKKLLGVTFGKEKEKEEKKEEEIENNPGICTLLMIFCRYFYRLIRVINISSKKLF